MRMQRTAYRVPRNSVKRDGRKAEIRSKERSRAFVVPEVMAWSGVAEYVSELLRPGTILAISGELGAGKTTFIQALTKTLGIKKVPPSPTFSLMRSYRLPKTFNGIRRIIHVDAYRFDDERELVVLDLDEELADGSSVLVIEWPEKMPKWLKKKKADLVQMEIA